MSPPTTDLRDGTGTPPASWDPDEAAKRIRAKAHIVAELHQALKLTMPEATFGTIDGVVAQIVAEEWTDTASTPDEILNHLDLHLERIRSMAGAVENPTEGARRTAA